MNGIPHDATDTELVELLREAAADVLIVGHTHELFARRLTDGKLAANPDALLRDPAPGMDVATPRIVGILTVENGATTFKIRRAADGAIVAYDRNRRRCLHPGSRPVSIAPSRGGGSPVARVS